MLCALALGLFIGACMDITIDAQEVIVETVCEIRVDFWQGPIGNGTTRPLFGRDLNVGDFVRILDGAGYCVYVVETVQHTYDSSGMIVRTDVGSSLRQCL
jgi:hypothetical protein